VKSVAVKVIGVIAEPTTTVAGEPVAAIEGTAAWVAGAVTKPVRKEMLNATIREREI
jgi:hypothetical protein